VIRLFLADIDGCLSEPYRPFDLAAFARLRAWGRRAESDPRVPRIGLCSGRSYAYVEATAQALGLRAPALFESGGGRFDLLDARITWNPALTARAEADLLAARAFMLREVVHRSATVSYDYGKRSQVGIVSPVVGECESFLPEVEAFVAAEAPDLTAFHTPYSIDVVPSALTKAQALRWLAATDGIALAELAFIGDTNGDAEAIATAGLGFAPANGSAAAQAAADVVTRAAVLDGVEEAYRACLRRNGLDEADLAIDPTE
jgi:hydroxymethylpyrimidine pyrophosphatase-like HAD family hydrolase